MQIRKNIFLSKILFIMAWVGASPSLIFLCTWPKVLSSAWEDSSGMAGYGKARAQIGFIKCRMNSNDWTEWMYQIGDESGFIVQIQRWSQLMGIKRWKSGLQRPYSVAQWSPHLAYQREGVRITLKSNSRYFGRMSATDSNVGDFLMYTFYENDPRDWETRENLDEDKLHLKVFLMFLVVINSAPRQ